MAMSLLFVQRYSFRCGSRFLFSPSRFSTAAGSQYEELFKYTSGRWIHNEKEQLAKRYLRFNVDGLKAVAAKAAGASSVVSMKKLQEGESNKTFLITLNNGDEVVARLPLPKAAPSRFITASEVATMDYVRTRLGMPTPRVLAWSSDPENNGVDCPYIIMEKAKGVCLRDVWGGLPPEMRRDTARKLVEIEKAYKIPISGGYGGLYYRKDLDQATSRDFFTDGVRETEFVLGPMTQPSFWGDRKAEMEGVDRGPWGEDPIKYLKGVIQLECDWLDKFKPEDVPEDFFSPASLKLPSEEHKTLLQRLMSATPHLLPPDPTLLQPSLIHPDMSDGNIFVSPEELDAGRIEITSIVDWQRAVVRPLYMSARMPWFIVGRFPGLDTSQYKLEDVPNMTPQDREELAVILEEKMVLGAYLESLKTSNPHYSHALNFLTKPLFVAPVLNAICAWRYGFIELRQSLISLRKYWDLLETGVPCPIEFTEEELTKHVQLKKEWDISQLQRKHVDAHLGVSPGGKTTVETYDAVVAENERLMEHCIDILVNADPQKDWALLREDMNYVWMYRPWEDLPSL